MTEMSLPERLVHAAEEAIEDQAEDVTANPKGYKCYGFTADFARYGVGAALDTIADELLGTRCCPADNAVSCSDGLLRGIQVEHLRLLAQQVRDVPALEAI